MIDKVITLENNLSYYILDEYKSESGDNYVFGVQVDKATETISSDYIFLKEISDLNDTYYNSIEDKDEFNKIGSIFLDRLTN